jgi:hypothetical protein
MWQAATADATQRLCLPDVDLDALIGLKFSEALPERLVLATAATRLADLSAAEQVGEFGAVRVLRDRGMRWPNGSAGRRRWLVMLPEAADE